MCKGQTCRLELFRELGVFVNGDLLVPLHPFTSPRDGIYYPIVKRAKSSFSPPRDTHDQRRSTARAPCPWPHHSTLMARR